MKKLVNSISVFFIFFIIAINTSAQSIPADSLYLGQTPPGFTPKIFQLPISNGLFAAERIAISSDGTEIYYTELNGYPISKSSIKRFHYENGKWNGPFDEMRDYIAPSLSIDGKSLFYENDNNKSFSSTRIDTTWSAPARFLSTSKMTHYLQMAKSGKYYLTSDPLISKTGDIANLLINNGDTSIVTLGRPVNYPNNGYDFFISPDESYIIRVIKSYGTGDLFISYHKADGSWTNPKTLGPQVNHPQGWEWGPYVTSDNKYLFFTRQLSSLDIYWVRIDNLIDNLKHTNFEPYIKNPIPDQTVQMGLLFIYQIPDSIFIDDNGDSTLTFSAKLNDGSPLSAWLSFDPVTRIFSGIPRTASTTGIKITATDKFKASVSSTFTIKVINPDRNANSEMKSNKKYFGQDLPGETPVLFAPQILNSLSEWVEATALSPDGNLFFASVGNADYSSAKLYYSKYVNNEWTSFTEAPFISDFSYSNEPIFSEDGTSLIFTGKKGSTTTDLWTVDFTNNSWGVPVALPSPFNSSANEFRSSTMSNGTFYFGSNRSGMMQIYKSTSLSAVELLGAPINNQSYEGDPCIASDGHFLIFHSGRQGGSSDLYVSFSDGQGGWKKPINLGPNYNSSSDEYGAHLSSDGKYLFFTRHTLKGNSIFWVSISAIEKLK